MRNRRFIQAFFLICSVYLGFAFVKFLKAVQAGDFSVVKPGGVEAFLPISAIMALKRFIFTGNWDWIHPAGLSLLLIFILVSFLFRRSFCGYICPVGFFSEVVSLIGRNKGMNRYAGYAVSVIKYAGAGFFLYFIVIKMPVEAITAFLNAPYNFVADAKMLDFFVSPGQGTIIFVIAAIGLTLVFKGFWCKYLCPYGVFLSIFSAVSPLIIKRDKDACVNCMKCTKACPMDIQVHKVNIMMNPDCIGCHDCLAVRHNEKCLQTCKKDIKAKHLSMAVFAVAVVLIIAAMAAGFWESRVAASDYAFWLSKLNQLSH
ncbi:4Fe-4S binding protein [Seleniivibrio woodruffii]|uniref:4Fe-4S binding protein n=1 Tax=Seleniivibrio woodruffii TaxID=1078050 RepID=A0A4R1K926_9BACT|nr:4Fe-4S binding protein [Seleniivibrio woodruffii]TCK60507.1 4Fe-4S binding protein [Seleniivibrio woodruffii]TVZ36135.1 4Fe-4S binding protein [Seleniivibrio woodruffii]